MSGWNQWFFGRLYEIGEFVKKLHKPSDWDVLIESTLNSELEEAKKSITNYNELLENMKVKAEMQISLYNSSNYPPISPPTE